MLAKSNLPQNTHLHNVVLTQTLQSTLTLKILPAGTKGRIVDTTHFNDKIVLFDGLPTVFVFLQYDNRIAIIAAREVSQ